MDDYISRQTALNVIANYDVVKYGANKYLWDLIYEIPPADVRPVVLCGDCAHWDRDTIEMHDRCNNAEEGVDKTQVRFAECLKFSSWAKCMMMREDDYCSVGRFAIKGIKDDANPCCGIYSGSDMRGGDADG